MAVRNFYVTARIDGRETELAGGPRAKDGGLEMVVNQRNHGGIDTALKVSCCACGDTLTTYIYVNRELVASYETER